MKRRRTLGVVLVAIAATAMMTVTLTLPGAKGPGLGAGVASYLPQPTLVEAAGSNPRAVAVKLVTGDRGEPTGKQAKVEVPSQLRHYSDTRRFLATQVAEWREHEFATPHDYADLAALISAGELVEVPSVSENFVLYGVGGLADKGPFTHYDKKAGESVALLDEAELEHEYTRAGEEAERIRGEIAAFRDELKSLGKKERARRAGLERRVAEREKALRAVREGRERLEDYYDNEESHAELAAERDALASLARNFRGRDYDLTDAHSRQEMKVRMLSHLRPEALAVLEELAESYNERFERPLPVTSLVRPDEYQRRLGESNANATRIDTPPHSTGLAFDILYRYMSAEEQAHVMADIARLRDEGRVEALRENRDHFHIFAFLDGRRPGEELIRASLGHSTASKLVKETRSEPRKANAVSKKHEKAKSRKAESKRAVRGKAAGKASVKKATAAKGRKRR